jgi:hypothetical protein
MLWGPVGVLLSTPLTVCLVVIGRHVPHLQFLHVMFGNDPVLPPDAKFYQRLLARDPIEAAELAEECQGDRPLAELYDTLVLPALRLAEADRQRGALENETQHAIADGIDSVIDQLDDLEEDAATGEDLQAPLSAGRVLCIAGRNELDRAAAALLSHLLNRAGGRAETLPCQAVSLRNLPKLDTAEVRLITLSYLNPGSVQHARRIVRRLRGRLGPSIPNEVYFWTTEPLPADAASLVGADRLATSIAQAVRQSAEPEILRSMPG